MLTFENDIMSVNIIMSITYNEKEATIGYLEFNLLNLCEQLEQHVDPDAVGMLYELAYQTLHDMDETLQARVDEVALIQFFNNQQQS